MFATPDSDSGLSALELAEISAPHRKLLQLILRLVEATEADIQKAVRAWLPAEQLEAAQLTEALQALCDKRWLNLTAEARYKVNFARRPAGPPLADHWPAPETPSAPIP